MPISRKFIDWNKPFLPQVAAELLKLHAPSAPHSGFLDLSSLTLIFPGRRAIRIFEEQLLTHATDSGLNFIPARHITVGGFLDALLAENSTQRIASPVEELFAAEVALKKINPGQIKLLFPVLPEPNNQRAWWELARLFLELSREIAAEAVSFNDLAKAAENMSASSSAGRFLLLEQIKEAWLSELHQSGLAAREAALAKLSHEGFSSQASGDLYLVGLGDQSELAKQLFAKLANTRRVVSFVFAPASRALAFDQFGGLNHSEWLESEIPIRATQIKPASDQTAQAKLLVEELAALSEKNTSTAAITIATADESALPYLREALAAAEVPAHFAVGPAVSQSAIFRVLTGFQRWLRSNAWTDFAVLLRVPEIEEYVRQKIEVPPGLSCATALDSYHAEFLPMGLNDLAGRHGEKASVRFLQSAQALLADLSSELVPTRQPLKIALKSVLTLLAEIFGSTIVSRNSTRHFDRSLVAALKVLERLTETLSNSRLSRELSGLEVVDLLLMQVSGERENPEPEPNAVEVVGWLELLFDDAPQAILTGANEGVLPAALTADPFLPDTLRRELGLLDNSRRLARDSYALTAILHSRPGLTLICPQKSARGEELLPSRLLFRCPEVELASRVLLLFKRQAAPSGTESQLAVSPWVLPPPPDLPAIGKAPLPRALAITSFKTWLECPYTYYLQQILKLRPLDDSALELDAPGFGSLLHEVLSAPAACESFGATDSSRIFNALSQVLDQLAGRRFGREALPAVYLQIEQMRARLGAFAEWQAQRTQNGWALYAAEFSLPAFQSESAVKLRLPDGGTIALSGRIDRLDWHEGTKTLAIIDYKTGESSYGPERVRTKNGEWRDLQLPLYALAKSELQLPGKLELGYLCLGKSEIHYNQIQLSETELSDAWQEAGKVAEAILSRRFFPPARSIVSADLAVLYPTYQQLSAAVTNSAAEDLAG